MRLKLTVSDDTGKAADVLVDAEAHTPVEVLAEWLAHRQGVYRAGTGYTLAVHRGDRSEPLRAGSPLSESGLKSGDVVVLGDASAALAVPPRQRAAVVRVIDGPDIGATFDLPSGSSDVGRQRDNAVVLRDPLVSKHHAKIVIGDVIEVIDAQSSNGIVVGGEVVSRVVVGPDDEIALGESTIVITRVRGAGEQASGGVAPFNRSPWLDPVYPGVKLKAPEPPQPPQPQRFPIAMMLMPLFMAAVLFLATKSVASIAFVAMSPLMMIGAWFEGRYAGRKQFEEATRTFRDSLADLVVQMQRAFEEERVARAHEHPSTAETVAAAWYRSGLLWARRPDRPSFLDVRLGLGTQPSRSEIEVGFGRQTTPELWAELQAVTDRFIDVDRVPVVGPLAECRAIGIGGPDPVCRDSARGLIAQLAALHSPAEVALAAILPAARLADWSWLKWLPHTDSEYSPVSAPHLASNGQAATTLVTALEELIERRGAVTQVGSDTTFDTVVVVLIEDEAPVEWARLVRVAEAGPAVGIFTVWVGASLEALPAVCGKFLVLDPQSHSSGVGNIVDGSLVVPVEVGFFSAADAHGFARGLAPLIDAGALLDDTGVLPASVSFAAEQGVALLDDAATVIERWHQSYSIGPASTETHGRRDRSLRAFVGTTPNGPMMLDLRAHGPHALVGGTTGAGKSEFLQTWLLGMATTHSPERVNFLLVDYKGGSAFGPCANLPHAVGLVTDLNPRLVRRVLDSLKAELTRREHLLNQWSAKDLLDLESKEPDGAPVSPSLVIVVDEFAALIQEIPEFVDGMIDIAQRGRSLGLHLVLATQRPQGVIKGNLRANTNLRIALRMADADDSSDVVGSAVAASFDPSLPGRAIARTGPGQPVSFQTAYVGGRTTAEAPPPRVSMADLPFGLGEAWEAPPVVSHARPMPGPKDLDRIVATINSAVALAEIGPPRRPWLDELAARYELSEMPTRRVDSELVFAVSDLPSEQRQSELSFRPDVEGNLAAFGTGGSGKSTFLRSIAIAAGLSFRGGPTAVYGLDFGARGLSMLEQLPHVGSIVGGDDEERVTRLIRLLRDLIDERAIRFAKVNAGTIDDYRRISGNSEESRVFLLVDHVGAFRTDYEIGPRARVFEAFQSIAMDGRAVGVHVVLTADRPNSVPSSLLSAIPTRLAMRTADEMDLAILGAPTDAFDASTPPGRAFLGSTEVHVAVLGGVDGSIASQAQAIDELAAAMRRAGVIEAPPIERLADRVRFSELPSQVDGSPVIGLADDTLGPFTMRPGDAFVVCGPPQSGKSTALLTLVQALHRWRPETEFTYFGNRRSPIAAQQGWARVALDDDDVRSLAAELREAIQTDAVEPARQVIVIESIGDFLQGPAEMDLQDLIRGARQAGATVISEAETAVLAQSWPLFKEARASRHGIVLQPDQMDGDNIFATPFGRVTRADFPEGRGMYVRAGRAVRVQLALPD